MRLTRGGLSRMRRLITCQVKRLFSSSVIMSHSECQSIKPGRVAVTQMTAVQDKDRNMLTCVDLIKQSAAAGAQMVFLPEACDYIAESKESSVALAEPLDGPVMKQYQQLASSLGVWLSLGGLHIKEKGDSKIRNTHIVMNDRGEIVSTYEKTHLFSVHIPEKKLHLEESAYVHQGSVIHPPVSTPVGELALAICYDMRFPELSLMQRKYGAHILTFPSAFTVTTGLAHWEALLRVRAIETQCYVIAAAQTGQHNKKRSSYGHAMIVDPWGKVVSEIEEGTDFMIADIDLNYLEKVRKEMPVHLHRRSDLYSLGEVPVPEMPRVCELMPSPSPYVSYQFGQVSVPGSCIFLKSRLSQAFVNKKPVVSGHTLVTPERPAEHLKNLTQAEVSDLAQLTQKAFQVILEEYKPYRCQVAIQDGPAAGQTINHIHVHIVPQSTAGIQKLQGHEDSSHTWREKGQMEEEASHLRQIAAQIFPGSKSHTSAIPKPMEVFYPVSEEPFVFGSVNVPNSHMVVKTRLSCAFVAPNPILNGHVYVTLLKPCEGFSELNYDEVTDLFLTVQLVQQEAERCNGTTSSTVVLLDSTHLTNTLHPLQIHIIPRMEGDLANNDDIYEDIQDHYTKCLQWNFSENTSSYANQLRHLVNRNTVS